jgi:hypothetical protein
MPITSLLRLQDSLAKLSFHDAKHTELERSRIVNLNN